jgi:hypothetical protein
MTSAELHLEVQIDTNSNYTPVHLDCRSGTEVPCGLSRACLCLLLVFWFYSGTTITLIPNDLPCPRTQECSTKGFQK